MSKTINKVREAMKATKDIVRDDMEILKNGVREDFKAVKKLANTTDWHKAERNMDRVFQRIDEFAVRFGRNVGRMALIGIVMHIIAAYFWPEMPDKIPTIYSWFDGWLQFAEFSYRCTLKGVYSLFTGNFPTFTQQYSEEMRQMWQMFVDWLQSM